MRAVAVFGVYELSPEDNAMRNAGFIVVVLAIIVGAGAWFIYSGAYSVAASEPHSSLVRWLFTTVRDQSIEEHARDVKPPQLDEAKLVKTGARHYADMCAVCHGAPGEERSEISRGLNPPPPDLQTGEIQKKYTEAELFWIVQHGIRMSGMPAFGSTHQEKDLWGVIAFVKQLPEMNPGEYRSIAKTGTGHDSEPSGDSG
jgi:mono/diheme cytochrome c family protein